MAAPGLPGRGGCLRLWLAFMIVGYALGILHVLLFRDRLQAMRPDVPTVYFDVMLAAGMLNISCVVALLRGRRWGFYGIALLSLGIAVYNYALGLQLQQSIQVLLGFLLLAGVLAISRPASA